MGSLRQAGTQNSDASNWDLLESGGSSELRYVFVAVVQLPNCFRLFATPWTAAHQASLSLIISQSLSKFMPIAISTSDALFSFCPQSFP